MGIKIEITQDKLPLKYKKFTLKETKDGLTHSVYLVGNKYVLKIVEANIYKSILSEQNLLKKLEKLCVPKLLDLYEEKDYTMVFYTQMSGQSIFKPTIFHIKQIATFLKEFHSISQNVSSSNEMIYEKEYLENLILQTKEPLFLSYFNTIDCDLKKNGVIHGDLFCDNAKFKDDILSGVFDFIEACEGDFIFELAVVAVSWCYEEDILNEKKVQILLDSYGLDISIKKFKEYMKYALLYYTTTRYLNNRNYNELLKRLKNL